MLWCPPAKPSVALSSMLTSLVSFWPDEECMTAGGDLISFPGGPGLCRIINIRDATLYWWQFCVKPPPCAHCVFEMWPIWGSKVTTAELRVGGSREALICSSPFNVCGNSFSGKFREKASILHKIAKKKCQVEDSEKANGVTSRSGKRLGWVPKSWILCPEV